MSRLPTLKRGRQRPGRTLVLLIVVACISMLLHLGCSSRRGSKWAETLSTDYGSVKSAVPVLNLPESVNGTGVLADMFREADHKVIVLNRISRRMERADCIVWFRWRLGAPEGRTEETLKKWLAARPGRTLIIVGRGYTADIGYWEELQSRGSDAYPIATRENLLDVENNLDSAERSFANQLDDYMTENPSCDWFSIASIDPRFQISDGANMRPGTLRVHRGGDAFVTPEGAEDKIEPTERIDDGEEDDFLVLPMGVVDGSRTRRNVKPGSVSVPSDEEMLDENNAPEGTKDKVESEELSSDEVEVKSSDGEYYDPVRATTFEGDLDWLNAFDPEGTDIRLYDRMRPRGGTTPILDSDQGMIVGSCEEGQGRVLTVVNGSFLLNLPLVNHEHRKMAGCLIREIGEESQTVCFLEYYDNDEDGPEWSGEPGQLWSLFFIWPTNILLIHLAVIGFLVMLWRWPIFGRPRLAPVDPIGDFSQHIDAMADLLERSGEGAAARQKIEYFQHLSEKLGKRYR